MILGSLSFSGNRDSKFYSEKLRQASNAEGLMFTPVSSGLFTGGFFIHRRLPLGSSDFYYTDPESDITVLLSGFFYNREELGRMFGFPESVSDPEVVALLYLRMGPEFIKNLNGDFVIFIFRQNERRALLFRDHIGVRPIAWTLFEGCLCFSSDLAGMCRSFPGSEAPASEFLLGWFKYIDYRTTPQNKVVKLLPGHYLEYANNIIRTFKYWFPEKTGIDSKLTYEHMIADLECLVRDAVRIRCDHRFVAGTHLSSGIDSGVVSHLAREAYATQSDFPGFSWSPEGYFPEVVKFDERELVNKSSAFSGIRLLFSDLNVKNFMEAVSSFYYNMGYFYEERVIAQAVQSGINLLFSGWGGDEFVSTGERGISLDLLHGMHLRIFFRRNHIRNFRNFVKNQLFYVVYPALGILDSKIKKSFRDDARYIRKPFKKSDRKAIRNFYFHSSRRQYHLRMLDFYHLQERCESWMINGCRKGIEYRYPLLDRRIIEYMLKVPTVILCRNSNFRPLLREIGRDLVPEEVRWNWSKNDPVWWSHMESLYEESSALFMEEADRWKDSADLDFIDFDLLISDVKKFKQDPGSIDGPVLFRALVYIKAIHEYTAVYQERR